MPKLKIEEILNDMNDFLNKKTRNNIKDMIIKTRKLTKKQEKELMKQFGETDSNEFDYDMCCTIFRQLIEQIEREIKVNEWNSFISFFCQFLILF